MSSFTDAQVQQTRSLEVLTLLRINRSFMEFMRKHYGHMPMAGFEPKYAKYGKAGRVHEPSCSFIRSPPVVVNRYHWLWHFFAKFGMCACRVMSQKAQKARPENGAVPATIPTNVVRHDIGDAVSSSSAVQSSQAEMFFRVQLVQWAKGRLLPVRCKTKKPH